MHLVTLIAACALKVMHALIFEQSGGEPWSFPVQGEGWVRLLPTIRDAMRRKQSDSRRTDRAIDRSAICDRRIFAPCLNITLAERQLTNLPNAATHRSRSIARSPPITALRIGPTLALPTRCGQPLRRAIRRISRCRRTRILMRTTLPPTLRRPGRQAARSAPALTPDDQQRGWSSPLFRAKPTKPDDRSANAQIVDRTAEEALSHCTESTVPATNKSAVNSRSVPRSSEQRP
jgi:hypothetical protein